MRLAFQVFALAVGASFALIIFGLGLYQLAESLHGGLLG